MREPPRAAGARSPFLPAPKSEFGGTRGRKFEDGGVGFLLILMLLRAGGTSTEQMTLCQHCSDRNRHHDSSNSIEVGYAKVTAQILEVELKVPRAPKRQNYARRTSRG